jgi:ATP-dependent Clp protease, protease subunit
LDDILSVVIPKSIENMQLPSPELITFYKNLEERTLWLDTEVSDLFLEYGRYIVQWNREDKGKPVDARKPIKLMLFSPGGSLSINNALIDLIKLSKTPIYGYNINMAYSSGCFIFMACHKRFALPGSVFLLHRGSGEFAGSYDEVVAQVIEYQRQIEELSKFIMENSKIDEDTLQENLGTEWYVTAEQAFKEYGFVDKIITSLDEIL